MTAVGRRPTLVEIIDILDACTEVVASAESPDSRSFRFTLLLDREKLANRVPDWYEGLPKPGWLLEEIKAYLVNYRVQRAREEQWVSKDIDLLSINNVMSYWTENLKQLQAKQGPESILDRVEKKIVANTIMRLQELKERREAGGVYSQTDDRREKARKTWMDDEYEAPKREEEQRRQREQTNYSQQQAYSDNQQWYDPWEGIDETLRQRAEELFKQYRGNSGPYNQQWYNPQPPPPKSGNKRAWHEILGVAVTASKKDITKAYRKLAARFHPDRYKEPDGHARMAEINTARDEGLGGL